MALPKQTSRAIEVDAMDYRYIISTQCAKEPGWFQLNLTVQIEAGIGCILKAEGLLTRDFWLDFPKAGSPVDYLRMKPKHVASIIRLARNSGWTPQTSGEPFVFQVSPDLLKN